MRHRGAMVNTKRDWPDRVGDIAPTLETEDESRDREGMQVGSLFATAMAAAVLTAGGCGDVTATPDGGTGGGDARAGEAGADGGGGRADGTPDDGGPEPDAQVCDEGFTGEACDECTVYVHDVAGDDESDGLSWDDAFATVQAGLAGAEARRSLEGLEECSVWVREGEYTPGGERTDSFELRPGVALYGGFSGHETARDERDWEEQETILSGELDGGESAYHVVIGTDDATLDGFTITGGLADRDDDDNDNDGGGMLNDDASPTIENAIFVGNRAEVFGGAMYNDGSSAPTLVNVTLVGNQAERDGGAMYNRSSSAPTLVNVTLSENQASDDGGAMYNTFLSAPTLMNVTLSDNQADRHGGAMYNTNSTAPTLVNVTLSGNEAAADGGAMRNRLAAEVEIVNSILWGNAASEGEDEISHDVDEAGSIAISSSIVEDMDESDFGGDGEVDVDFDSDDDPEFADAGEGDLRLTEDSPAIDAGDDEVTGDEDFPEEDLDGDPRVAGEDIDLGPYEFQE